MYYCYICNQQMTHTVYVCTEHEYDPRMSGAFRYILAAVGEARRLGPREWPDAPLMDLSRFGISVDPDLHMDEGL